jgi:trehalose 6-phosphate phosphatase
VETMIELSVVRSAIDVDPTRMQARIETLFRSVAKAEMSTLCLDFDGTLAPFRVDPMTVHPWAGVVDLLDAIQQTGRTRLAIVSGRPSQDVVAQLGLQRTPEIWGLHGAERRYPDGTLQQQELSAVHLTALAEARAAIVAAHPDFRLEEKHNSVGVHWRGVPAPNGVAAALEAAKVKIFELLKPIAAKADMRLLQFDGGLELRAGRDKGDALALILSEMPATSPVAYLGDDVTDEDAFAVLRNRGLSVLVRRHWRPTEAKAWLRPPVQLRRFLRDWLAASSN